MFNTLRKFLARLGLSILFLLVGHTQAAATQNDLEKCSIVFHPLIIQVEFFDVSKNINTRFIKKKYLDDLDEYIQEMSLNRVCIKGEVTEKWYKMPRPMKDYWVPWQNLQVNRSNLKNLVSDTLDAVDKDLDVSKYDFVVIALGATFREWGNNGVAAYPGMLGWKSDESLLTSSGRKVNRGIAVFASTVQLGHIFHDVAHILGGVVDGKRVLPCLYDQDIESGSTTKDPGSAAQTFIDAQINMGGWDPMSCNNCTQRPKPPGISAWTRLRLGWVQQSKIRTVNQGEKNQFTLGPSEDPMAKISLIKVPVSATSYYLIENRQFMGRDAYAPGEGVLIMYADDTIGESRHGNSAVRLMNANPAVAHFEGAAFDITKNSVFTDDKNSIQVKLVAKNDRSYEILVTNKVP